MVAKRKKTCGDFGGLRQDGIPCTRPAGWGMDREIGPCRDHSEGDNIRHPQKRAFIAAYPIHGNICAAAADSGIHRSTHYRWLEEDPDYKQAFEHAADDYSDLLEAEATRRAVGGVEEPVYYKGFVVGHIRRYSDVLLIFKLKGHRPEKYRERYEHTGPGGGPLQVQKIVYKIPDNDRDR